jgi:hypothetical protein
MTNFLRQKLNALLKPVLSAVLLILLTTGCVTTGLATAASSPWQTVPLSTSANPLDVAFTDANHGFLVGSNRLVMETNDGGKSWEERALELPAEENFRLISIDFLGQEGWIAGQPGLLLCVLHHVLANALALPLGTHHHVFDDGRRRALVRQVVHDEQGVGADHLAAVVGIE